MCVCVCVCVCAESALSELASRRGWRVAGDTVHIRKQEELIKPKKILAKIDIESTWCVCVCVRVCVCACVRVCACVCTLHSSLSHIYRCVRDIDCSAKIEHFTHKHIHTKSL